MVVWGGFEPMTYLRFIRTVPIPCWRPYHIFPRLIFLESNQIVCIFQILTLPLFYLLCEPNDDLYSIRRYNLHFSANVFRVVPKMRKVTVPW